jgi:hypothetical protein
VFVLISAGTTFLTMRQSQRRGMMNQTAPDPDQPGAAAAQAMSKNMMYIAPFFALTGLYWQFGLVIYWVTTNVWTLGQQHFLFRNLPVVDSATVGASAVQAAPKSASVSGKAASASGKTSASGRTSVSGKTSVSAKSSAAKTDAAGKVGTSGKAVTGKSETPVKTGGSGKPGGAAKPVASKAAANGSAVTGTTTSDSSGSVGSALGRLRFGKGKSEPEAVPAAPQTKVVRQQPARQTRSKRSGKR